MACKVGFSMSRSRLRSRREFFALDLERLEPRHLLTGVELISIDTAGDSAGPGIPITATNPAISFSGRFVAFQSDATDLVSGVTDTNGGTDVFVRDRLLGTTTVISVTPGGGRTGSSRSFDPSISDDGRYIAFGSAATDLVTTPLVIDAPVNVYVRDRDTDKDGVFDEPGATSTRLLSINSLLSGDGSGIFGGPSGGDAFGFGVEALRPRISGNGLFVTFGSFASNLSLSVVDSNLTTDVFRVPTSGGASPTMVSDDFEGEFSGANGVPVPASNSPDISRDGRFIAFVSAANNLSETNEDTTDGTEPDIYVHDEKSGLATLMSVNFTRDDGGDAASVDPDLSNDGRYVVWESAATDLTAPGVNTNGLALDVFRRRVSGGPVELVSITAGGRTGSAASENPSISDNGRFVAFQSEATDLITDPAQLAAGVVDANGEPDIYVRDMVFGTTALVSINAAGTASGIGATAGLFGTSLNPVISGNGRFVVFESFAEDLVAGTVTEGRNLFVRDLTSGVTRLASEDADPGDTDDSGPNLTSSLFQQVISNDGSVVAFKGDAPDLVVPDSNGMADVFAFEGTPDLILRSSITSASDSTKVILRYERDLSSLIGPFEFAFYLSTDELFSPDDVLVGSRLATGTTRFSYVVDLVTATDFALPGEGIPDLDTDYYLLGVVDHLDPDTIEEADADDYNEDNTTAFVTSYQVAGTPWMVHGTGDDDVVSYESAAGSLTLSFNGRTQSLPIASVPATRIRVHDGDDTVTGSALPDLILGGTGNDTLDGGAGDDTLEGGLGNDVLTGGLGNDTLFDGPGDDLVDVGVGDDTVIATPGSDDTFIDGGGLDTLDFSRDNQPITLDLDSTAVQTVDPVGNTVQLIGQWENFVGSPFGNTLTARPIPTDRHLQGGAAANDRLIVDAAGNPVTDDGSKLDIPGFGSIFYSGFEEVVVINSVPRIVDDSDPLSLFSAPGFFPSDPGFPQGYSGGVQFSAANAGNTATWTFDGLPPGQYAVSATWTFAGDRASDSPFTIREGGPNGAILANLNVNQEQNPGEFDPVDDQQSILFRNLAIVQTTGRELTVQLTDVGADQFVTADAVRIEPVQVTRVLDDGSPDFLASGFTQQVLANNAANRGGFGDVHTASAVGATATYSFSGLEPGFYNVSATWTAGIDRATNASFTAHNGVGAGIQVNVNQQFAPGDFVEAGLNWNRLGRVVVGADGLLDVQWGVPLSAAGVVVADAVRIDPAPQLEVSVQDFERTLATVSGDFGTVVPGLKPDAPLANGQTVTVENRADGTSDYLTTVAVLVANRGPLSQTISPQVVGTGFSLRSGMQTQVVPPGSYATFFIDLLVTTPGMFAADVSFLDGGFASEPFGLTINVPVVADDTPPTVEIVVPPAGETLIEGETIEVQIEAQDDLGLALVEFLVDGIVQGSQSSGGAFAFTPAAVAAVQSVQLTARVTDRAGNTTLSTPVAVNIAPDAPPQVDLVSPLAGDFVFEGENVPVVVDAFDDIAIQRVEFLINGQVVAVDDTAGDRFLADVPISFFNTIATLTVRAIDVAGQATSEEVELNRFDDAPPTVHLVTPDEGTTVITGTSFMVQIAASDDVQVARVDLIVGDQIVQTNLPMVGGLFRAQVTAPATPGQLAIRAQAVDPFGNTAHAEVINVTVAPPSGTVRALQTGAFLRLIGSSQADGVEVMATGTGRVQVAGLNGTTVNQLAIPVPFQNVSFILGDLGGDHDLIRLSSSSASQRLPLTTLYLQNGNDTAELVNAQFAAALFVFAGNGNDTLNATNSGLESFSFWGGSGDDSVQLTNTTVRGVTTAYLEAGTNELRATDTVFRNLLSVLGGSSRDVVDFTRSTAQSVVVLNLGRGNDAVNAVDALFSQPLSIWLGEGDNSVNFERTRVRLLMSIFAGNGNDDVELLASDIDWLFLFAGLGQNTTDFTGSRIGP